MTTMSEGLQLNLLVNGVGRECTSYIFLLIAISSCQDPLFYRVVDVVDYQQFVLLLLLYLVQRHHVGALLRGTNVNIVADICH